MNNISKRGWIIAILIFGSLGILFIVRTIIPLKSDLTADKTSINFYQTRLDLGTLKYREPKTAEFIFTNSGINKLIIYDVKPTCGCTNADWAKKPIKNGESGIISVVYDAETIGIFEKSIVVYCNNETGSVGLQILGEVIAK